MSNIPRRYFNWQNQKPQQEGDLSGWQNNAEPRQSQHQHRNSPYPPPNKTWQVNSGWQSGGVLDNFNQLPNPANDYNRSSQYAATANPDSHYFTEPQPGTSYSADSNNQYFVSEQNYNNEMLNMSNSDDPFRSQSFVGDSSSGFMNTEMQHSGTQHSLSTVYPPVQSKHRTWPPPILKKKKKVNSSPLGLLNENKITVQWNVTDGNGTVQPFTATACYQNMQYVGTGMSKKNAMNDAAKQVLQAAGVHVAMDTSDKSVNTNSISELNQLVMSKKYAYRPDYVFSLNGPPFSCKVVVDGWVYQGEGSSKKIAKAVVAQKLLDAINRGAIAESTLKPATENPTPSTEVTMEVETTGGSALAQMNNLFRPQDINWEFNAENLAGSVFHTASLTIQEKTYAARNVSKKAAKNKVAADLVRDVSNGLIQSTITKKGKKRSISDSQKGDNGTVEKAANSVQEPANKIANLTPVDYKVKPEENAITKVTQLCSEIEWQYQQEGPPHKPVFTASASLSEQVFSGQGDSKKKAKLEACKSILNAISNGALELPKKAAPVQGNPGPNQPQKKKTDLLSKCGRLFGKLDWQISSSSSSEGQGQGAERNPAVSVSLKIQDRTLESTVSDTLQAKLDICEQIMKLVDAGDLQPTSLDTDKCTSSSESVHKSFPGLVWEYKRAGPVHLPAFTAVVNIQGHTFEGLSGSKKAARQEACDKIMEAVENSTIEVPPKKQPKKESGLWAKFNSVFGSPDITVDNSGEGADLVYTAKCVIDGVEYQETGTDEKSARINVAFKLHEMLKNGEIQAPVLVKFKKFFKTATINVSQEGSGFVARFSVGGKDFEVQDTQSHEAAEQKVASEVLEALEKDEITVDQSQNKTAQTANTSTMTPLSILNQMYQQKLEYEVEQNATKVLPFIVKATVDGKDYRGSGRSKMAAKHACASVILSEKFNYKFDVAQPAANSFSDMDKGDIGSIDAQSLSTRVYTMVTDKYNALASRLGERYSIRKVLAGCVVTIGDNLDTAELITLAAGTKCIEGGNMSQNGDVVNDMHAEILVRRALKKYLYDQIQNLKEYQPSIIEHNDSKGHPPYRVTDGARFHLFITSPPCGDSRLFTVSSEQDSNSELRDTNPNRINRGQLRVKIENGQGTIPIKASERNSIQTYDGVMAGDRYLNMSCSDKVASWNILGFQGSLLSKLIEPVYFSSIILGSMFHKEHVYRGLYGRYKDSLPAEQISQPFRLHCPQFIGTIISEVRNTLKPPNHAMVWLAADDQLEVLDTRNGKSFELLPSRFCKKALFVAYRQVAKGSNIRDVYDEEKKTATNYRQLKKTLVKALAANNLGEWACKPPEQDLFVVNLKPTIPGETAP